jgi:hypothetical protein
MPYTQTSTPFDSMELRDIRDPVITGPGAESLQAAADALQNVAAKLGDLSDHMAAVERSYADAHDGDAAEQTKAYLRRLGEPGRVGALTFDAAAQALRDQAVHYSAARGALAGIEPTSPSDRIWGGGRIGEQRRTEAAQVATAYEAGANQTLAAGFPQFTPVTVPTPDATPPALPPAPDWGAPSGAVAGLAVATGGTAPSTAGMSGAVQQGGPGGVAPVGAGSGADGVSGAVVPPGAGGVGAGGRVAATGGAGGGVGRAVSAAPGVGVPPAQGVRGVDDAGVAARREAGQGAGGRPVPDASGLGAEAAARLRGATPSTRGSGEGLLRPSGPRGVEARAGVPRAGELSGRSADGLLRPGGAETGRPGRSADGLLRPGGAETGRVGGVGERGGLGGVGDRGRAGSGALAAEEAAARGQPGGRSTSGMPFVPGAAGGRQGETKARPEWLVEDDPEGAWLADVPEYGPPVLGTDV